MLINARTLNAIRAQAVKTLTDRCAIYRQADGVDADGYTQEGRVLVAQDVACRMLPSSSADGTALRAMQETLKTGYRLALAWGADVRTGDAIAVGGRTYDVSGVVDMQTDAVFVTVHLVEVRRV